MNLADLTSRRDHAYKFPIGDKKWSPLLHYVKSRSNILVFEPVEDTESTLTNHVIHIFLADVTQIDKVRHFVLNPKYDMWERAK